MGAVAPVLTATNELRTRSQETLLEVTGTEHLALSKGDVPKVMTGGTAPKTFEAFQLTVIDKGPLLHAIRASTPVLVHTRRAWQDP